MWGSVEEKGRFVAELLGQHRYQLDAKGRIALPTRFREPFADGAYLTLGQDGCLYVFPQAEFQRQSEEVRGLRPIATQASRDYARMFFGNADRADLDGQGRLTVPQRLRAQIGLQREAVVVGVYDHLEIWAGPAWDTYERDRTGAYSSGVLEPEGR
jgi:MraZ protein